MVKLIDEINQLQIYMMNAWIFLILHVSIKGALRARRKLSAPDKSTLQLPSAAFSASDSNDGIASRYLSSLHAYMVTSRMLDIS